MKLLLGKPWFRVFGESNAAVDNVIPDTNSSGSGDNGTTSIVSNGVSKTFTQDEVNKFLAEDRRKHKQQTEKLISDLEALKKNKSLSDVERGNLQTRIEELQNQIMTKEQLLEKERAKLQNQHQTELQRERADKENWKNRYTESTIERSIMDAAISADTYNPEQIVTLLKTTTRLVEEVDSEGNGLGIFSPRVKFKDTDAEGKPTLLDLSVSEAIKRMRDLPEKYGNLFKSGLTGGLGGTGSAVTSKGLDINKIKSMDEYRKNRNKIFETVNRKR